jgi:hypothetical protein
MLDIDDIEARWTVGIGLPWVAEKRTQHSGAVRDNGGEAIALTYCTSTDLVHGAGMANLIASAPEDIAALIAEIRRLRQELEENAVPSM